MDGGKVRFAAVGGCVGEMVCWGNWDFGLLNSDS